MSRAIRLADYVRAGFNLFRREVFDLLNAMGRARLLSSGPSPKGGLNIVLKEYRSTDAARGAAILDGRFQLAGHLIYSEDPFVDTAPSRRFALALHSFDWLRNLLSSADETAEVRAGELLDKWRASFDKWSSFAWAPEIASQRLINWALAAPLFETDPDRQISFLRQARHLRHSIRHTPKGVDEIRGGTALILSGLVFDQPALLEKGRDILDQVLPQQIWTDGGHISRTPSTAAEILGLLALIDTAMAYANRNTPESVSKAMDRLAPILRFFRIGDGGLVSFHGSGEGDRRSIEYGLSARDTGLRSFGFAPNSGYQRIECGGGVIVMDVGKPPSGTHGHASALAIELSAGGQRLVVNCGWTEKQPDNWREAVRATAAHSTLTIEESSSARMVPPGWKQQLLGPRFDSVPEKVIARRNEEDIGTWIEASHDGYAETFGLHHRRRLFFAADGGDLRGEDGLFRPIDGGPPEDVERRYRFAIRFHLHPSIRASLARDGMSTLLVLGNGDGWRFRSDGGPIKIEPSVYLAAGDGPKRTSQIVIQGDAEPFGAGERPPNRVRWAFQRLGRLGAT